MAISLDKVLAQVLKNQMHILRIMIFDHRKEFDEKDLLLEVDGITNETDKIIEEIEEPE